MIKKELKSFIVDIESNFDSFIESFEDLDSYLQGEVLTEEEKEVLVEELDEDDWIEICFKIAKNLYLEGKERVKLIEKPMEK